MASISDLRRGPDGECAAFVRAIADDLSRRIENGLVTAADARELASRVRFQAALLMPSRMDTFDRIYAARFDRLIDQFLLGGS